MARRAKVEPIEVDGVDVTMSVPGLAPDRGPMLPPIYGDDQPVTVGAFIPSEPPPRMGDPVVAHRRSGDAVASFPAVVVRGSSVTVADLVAFGVDGHAGRALHDVPMRGSVPDGQTWDGWTWSRRDPSGG